MKIQHNSNINQTNFKANVIVSQAHVKNAHALDWAMWIAGLDRNKIVPICQLKEKGKPAGQLFLDMRTALGGAFAEIQKDLLRAEQNNPKEATRLKRLYNSVLKWIANHPDTEHIQ